MPMRWSRAIYQVSRLGLGLGSLHNNVQYTVRTLSSAATAAAHSAQNASTNSAGNLDKMFRSNPCSLALAGNSPLRIEEPKYDGIRHVILKMMLFYSKQSKSIRGANVVYRRILSQVDQPAIYEVFYLEKTFKSTFSLLVLHMWLCLRRLKEEGKEGVEFGQYLYEIYNHDVELRVSKSGVNLLLTRWMKELEKIFYGNVIAYDSAMSPEAKQDDLEKAIWRYNLCKEAEEIAKRFHALNFALIRREKRNVFSDGGSAELVDPVLISAVQAMARYARREFYCLSLTDKEAVYSGNFRFSSLKKAPDAVNS